MKDLKGKLAIDTSALIELIYCDSLGQKLKKALETGMIEAYTTELAITELRFVLCRKLGWRQSKGRVDKLLDSGYLAVEDTSQLINEAAKIKCQRAMSLPDCFILALAHKIAGNALFARQEQELADEMGKKSFDITLLFLEDPAKAKPS
ncbi:MAG TPA: PIN domain-containing protein [Candidatus Bathyarchaeia archaeon]|nr:PIN domain-containing protein [Candidatus Bathyarchaeia archaeon]